MNNSAEWDDFFNYPLKYLDEEYIFSSSKEEDFIKEDFIKEGDFTMKEWTDDEKVI